MAPILQLAIGAFLLYSLWLYSRAVRKTRKPYKVLNPPARLSYINSVGDEIELEVSVLDYDFERLASKFEVIRPSKGPEYLFEHFRKHPEMYFNPETERCDK
jgi:hypothetical protein